MPINVTSKELFFCMTCIEGSRKERVSMIRAKAKTYCPAEIPDFGCPAPIVKGLWMWLMVVRTTHRSYRHGATIVAQDPNRPRSRGCMESIDHTMRDQDLFAGNVRWRGWWNRTSPPVVGIGLSRGSQGEHIFGFGQTSSLGNRCT